MDATIEGFKIGAGDKLAGGLIFGKLFNLRNNYLCFKIASMLSFSRNGATNKKMDRKRCSWI